MEQVRKIVLKNEEQVIFVSSDNYDVARENNVDQNKLLDCLSHCSTRDIFNCVFAIENNSITYEELIEILELENFDIDFETLKMILLHYVYESRIHQCWNECKNGYPSKCGKVFDLPKELIEEYPFIQQGFQVIGDEGIERFVVVNCAHYEYLEDHKGKPMSRRR